jgi:site-specific DNA-cytosine methylase
MSKDQTTQPTLFQEDSPVNHSALQENEKERMMTAISGMKLLESLPKQNQNGLLEKMLKELLTSPMVQSCNRYNKTWKKRVSKSNVLLFQLQVSVLGIKEKESGLSDAMFQTPTATEIPMRSKEAMEKRKKYRESIGRKTVPHGNLLEQIQMMYPTPKARDHFPAVESNTSDNERYGGGSGKECGNKGWTSTSKRNWSKIRSKSSRCSEQTLSNTNSKGLQGCSLPTELEREQRQVITKRDTERQQTWWEAQSSLCGVPNGISYELDKDRTNRIKALGNSIVPLIAYEIGKAIISAEDQSD